MRVSGYGKVGDERRLVYDSSVFGEGDDVCGTLARDLRCLLQLAIYGNHDGSRFGCYL